MPLRLLTAGESHGPRLTAILEGLPAGLTIDPAFVARELARRQHGYGRGGRMKIEKDEALFEGGVRGGRTLGSPIAIGILNRDFANWEGVMGPLAVDPAAADDKRVTRPRPGHADLAGGMKYGAADLRDVLERASARESAARVAAGAVCKLLLSACGIEVRSGVLSLGPVVDDRSPRAFSSLENVREDSPLRAVDSALEPKMVAAIDDAKKDGETLGGSILVGGARRPGGPRELRVLGPPARRADRAGAALGAGGQGRRVRLGDRGLARARLAGARRDRARAGRGAAPAHQPRRGASKPA